MNGPRSISVSLSLINHSLHLAAFRGVLLVSYFSSHSHQSRSRMYTEVHMGIADILILQHCSAFLKTLFQARPPFPVVLLQ